MTKEEFINIFNVQPEDVLGNDWELYVESFLSDKYDEKGEGIFN